MRLQMILHLQAPPLATPAVAASGARGFERGLVSFRLAATVLVSARVGRICSGRLLLIRSVQFPEHLHMVKKVNFSR